MYGQLRRYLLLLLAPTIKFPQKKKKKNHISKLPTTIDSTTKNISFGYRPWEADRLYLQMTNRLGELESHRFLFFVFNQESNQIQGKKVHWEHSIFRVKMKTNFSLWPINCILKNTENYHQWLFIEAANTVNSFTQLRPGLLFMSSWTAFILTPIEHSAP